jgi:hypothetical protein
MIEIEKALDTENPSCLISIRNLLLVAFSIPFACILFYLLFFVYVVLTGCEDIIPYRRNVKVAPLMDLVIPPDMDLSPWTNPDAGYQSIGRRGVFTNVERFPSVAEAYEEFHIECEHAHYKPRVTYGGQGDNQYCVSPVDTGRSDPEGFCLPSGDYRSYVIIQKDDVVIEIYEESIVRNSSRKDEVIAQLAAEISQAIVK